MSFHKEPVTFPVFVLIFLGGIALATLIRRLSKTPQLGADARRFSPYFILVIFIILAAVNAFANWRLGLPQF
ncbi:putative membrane protein YadS [Granulicella aggregans]|uniref:Putative membrane protein YadS n=1 Tax=Granulicella aggregans TaxID=474949 RepID=A0A7W8E738_9BACT|nr:putative membrane protein YadS [Granulicella aggregans]